MKECIILAGGLGTRLKSVVADKPKCMAEVSGRPFLAWLLDYLEKQSIDHAILSLGYGAECVLKWLEEQQFNFKISTVVENEPLGTGGALKFAFSKAITKYACVVNGDTFFDVELADLLSFHEVSKADISIALKQMVEFDRYGTVQIDNRGRIMGFNEKEYCKKGLINGGIYYINKTIFDDISVQKFSFEKEILENQVNVFNIYGKLYDSYFIDIGVPKDFEQANTDFKKL